jgi:hypothetical protein
VRHARQSNLSNIQNTVSINVDYSQRRAGWHPRVILVAAQTSND